MGHSAPLNGPNRFGTVHAPPGVITAPFQPGVAVRTLTVSLLGAAAVAASLLLLRQQREDETRVPPRVVPPGETLPAEISLDRLRERGF